MTEFDVETFAWRARLDDFEAALDLRELEWLGRMNSEELASHADQRDRIADERDQIARRLSRIAAARDVMALARDANASTRDRQARRSLGAADPGFRDRVLAGMDRDLAAGDRAEALADREDAADHRDRAADARAHAAAARRASAGRELTPEAAAGAAPSADLVIAVAVGVLKERHHLTTTGAIELMLELTAVDGSDPLEVARAIVETDPGAGDSAGCTGKSVGYLPVEHNS